MTFLTKKEKYVILFLVFGTICGISYSYYKEYHSPIRIDLKKDRFYPRASQRKDLDDLIKEEKTVNINSANLEELMRLEGVGPVLANRIIEYRNNNGPFSEKQEIKNVAGIGDKKFNAIKDYIELK